MFELKTDAGAKWVNPDHIVSAVDTGGYVTVRTSDGQTTFAKDITAERIARIMNEGHL